MIPNQSLREDTKKLQKIILQSLEETMGLKEANLVLAKANLDPRDLFSPPNLKTYTAQIDSIQKTLKELYGERSSYGLALQMGRVCFKYSLQEFGNQLGFVDKNFRLMPPKAKLKFGLGSLVQVLNLHQFSGIHLEENASHYYWNIEECPLQATPLAHSPGCDMLVGFLQEFTAWVNGGKHTNIVQKACSAKEKPACSIIIDKQAMD